MKRLLLLLASAILLFGCTAAPKPIPVIFDTDMGNDIDDALALQMLGRKPELRVTGVDILPQAVERTRLNGELNGHHIRTVCGDIRDLPALFPGESFDLAAGNLPYYPGTYPGAGEAKRDLAAMCRDSWRWQQRCAAEGEA